MASAEKTKKAEVALSQALSSEKRTAEADYEQANTARHGELDAIAQAIEILSTNQEAALMQLKSTSFLQMKRYETEGKDKAISFLRNKASSIHSKVLLMLTEVATQDPFAKVKGLITDLITKLEEEAAAAQSKHDRCVKDMNENKAQIEETESNISKLNTEIESEQAA